MGQLQHRIQQQFSIHVIIHQSIGCIASILLGTFIYSYASQPSCHIHIAPIVTSIFTLLAQFIGQFSAYFIRLGTTSRTLAVSAILGVLPLLFASIAFLTSLVSIIVVNFVEFPPDSDVFRTTLYLISGIAILALPYTFQDSIRFLLHRFTLPSSIVNPILHQPLKNKLHWVRTPYGDIVPFTFIKAGGSAVATIIYAHANASSLIANYFSLQFLSINLKCDVIIFEYPGYSLASGHPEEHRLLAALECVYIAVITNGNMVDDQQYRCINDSVAVPATYHRYPASELLSFFIKQTEQQLLRKQQLIRNERLQQFKSNQNKSIVKAELSINELINTDLPNDTNSIEDQAKNNHAHNNATFNNSNSIPLSNSDTNVELSTMKQRDSLNISKSDITIDIGIFNPPHNLSNITLTTTDLIPPPSHLFRPQSNPFLDNSNSAPPSSNDSLPERSRNESFVAPLPSTSTENFHSKPQHFHSNSLPAFSLEHDDYRVITSFDLDTIDTSMQSGSGYSTSEPTTPPPNSFVRCPSNIEHIEHIEPITHTAESKLPDTPSSASSSPASPSKVTFNPRFLNLHINTNTEHQTTPVFSIPLAGTTQQPLENDGIIVSPSRQTMFNRDRSQLRSQSQQPLNSTPIAPLYSPANNSLDNNSPQEKSCTGEVRSSINQRSHDGFMHDGHGNRMAHLGSAFTPTHQEFVFNSFSNQKQPQLRNQFSNNQLNTNVNKLGPHNLQSSTSFQIQGKQIHGDTSGSTTQSSQHFNLPLPLNCSCPPDHIKKQVKNFRPDKNSQQKDCITDGIFEHDQQRFDQFYRDITQFELIELQTELSNSIYKFNKLLEKAKTKSESQSIHQEGMYCSGTIGIRSQRIIFYGRSLGTAVTSITAANICRKQKWVQSMNSISQLQNNLYNQLEQQQTQRQLLQKQQQPHQSQQSQQSHLSQQSQQPLQPQHQKQQQSTLPMTHEQIPDVKSNKIRWATTDSVISLGYEPSVITSALSHLQLNESEKQLFPIISTYLPTLTPHGLNVHFAVDQHHSLTVTHVTSPPSILSTLPNANTGSILLPKLKDPGPTSSNCAPDPKNAPNNNNSNVISSTMPAKPTNTQFNSVPHLQHVQHLQTQQQQQQQQQQLTNPPLTDNTNIITNQPTKTILRPSANKSTVHQVQSGGFPQFVPSKPEQPFKPRGNLGKSGTSDNLAPFTPQKLILLNSSKPNDTKHTPEELLDFPSMDLVSERDLGSTMLKYSQQQHKQQQNQQQKQQKQQKQHPGMQTSPQKHISFSLAHASSCALYCPNQVKDTKVLDNDELIKQLEAIPNYSLDDDLRQAISVFSSTPEPLFTCGLRIPTKSSYQYPKSQRVDNNTPSIHLSALILESPFKSILSTHIFLTNSLHFFVWFYTYLICCACCCSTSRIRKAGKESYQGYLDSFSLDVRSNIDFFRTSDVIQDITVPTLYCHGKLDDIVPHSHSVQLRDRQVNSAPVITATDLNTNSTNTLPNTPITPTTSTPEQTKSTFLKSHFPFASIATADHEMFMPKPYLYQVSIPKSVEHQTPKKRGLASPTTRKDSASTRFPPIEINHQMTTVDDDDGLFLSQSHRDRDHNNEQELTEELYRIKTKQNEISLKYMILLREFIGYSNWLYNKNSTSLPTSVSSAAVTPTAAANVGNSSQVFSHPGSTIQSIHGQGYGVDYFYQQQLTKHQSTPLGSQKHFHFGFGRVSSFGSQPNTTNTPSTFGTGLIEPPMGRLHIPFTDFHKSNFVLDINNENPPIISSALVSPTNNSSLGTKIQINPVSFKGLLSLTTIWNLPTASRDVSTTNNSQAINTPTHHITPEQTPKNPS